MANFCVYLPKKGTELFKSLKKEFGYDTAVDIFYAVSSPTFKEKYKKSLKLDSEGFPLLESVVANKEVQKYVGDSRIIESISKDYNDLEDTIDNYSTMITSAKNFNLNSPYRDNFIAYVGYSPEGKLRLEVEVKSEEGISKFENQASSYDLNSKLANIFKSIGVTIEDLSDAEIGAGRVGVADFSKAKDIARGFSSIIRVANNMEGAQALSEEFSHLIIGILRNSPLVQRSINALMEREDDLRAILGDDYEDVVKFYNDDASLVAEEALGHLLKDNLEKENSLNSTSKPTLFRRAINYIKNLFKRFDPIRIESAIIEADISMDKLAKDILSKSIELTAEDVVKSQRDVAFNALSTRIDRNIKILQDAIKVETKKLKIVKDDNDSRARIYENIEDAFSSIEDENTTLGIFRYAESALAELKSLNDGFKNFDKMDSNLKFKFLRSVRMFNQSYSQFIKDMTDAIIDEENEADNLFLERFEDESGVEHSIKEMIMELDNMSTILTSQFSKKAIPMFAEFLKPFLGENVEILSGEDAGKKLTVEALIREKASDISFMDKWLDSMADSSDVLLQLVDDVVKSQKEKIRKATLKDIKDIQLWMLDAEKAGITSFDWMFETDSEGNKSGNYISAVNNAQFKVDRENFYREMDEKYGVNPTGEQATNKIKEIEKWLEKHASSKYNDQEANSILYRNEDFFRLSPKKRELLARYLALKEKFDDLYPEGRTSTNKAIQIRKSGFQRFVDSTSSVGTMWENLKEAVSDTFMDRVDDDEVFGENRAKKGLRDFEGREFLTLPVLYTTRLENPNEITTDVVGALMCYAFGANTYYGMDAIVDPLEIGRVIISDPNMRKVRKTRGSNPLIEKLEENGVTVASKIFKTDGTNIAEKYDSFMESQVYQRYLKDEGTVAGVNVNKFVSAVLKTSSIAQLGFNFLANIANVATGVCMQNIEAYSKEFFSAGELFKADGIYTKEMVSYMSEFSSRLKTSKLYLFDEFFNIKQDFSSNIKRTQKKNLLERLFGSHFAFFGQEAGDHWMYNRTAIAMCLRTKVIVPGKGEVSLWDALQIRDVHKGEKRIKEMYIPEGTTDLEGNILDPRKISRKINHVNQHLFGIYNDEDSNAANRVALGRLLMQYRKWMKPQFNKRFQAQQYSVALGQYEEGYYRTVFRLANELIRGKYQMGATWNNLKPHEKANIRRALFEVLQFFAVAAIANFVDWGDPKKRPYAMKLAEYTSRRLTHELGALSPINTVFLNENLKTVKTPMASLSMAQSIINLINSTIDPREWNDELQSGPYKGMSTLHKNILKAPIPGITHYRQIDRFLNDIDTSIQFYIRSY